MLAPSIKPTANIFCSLEDARQRLYSCWGSDHVIQELWDSNKPMACGIIGPDDFQLDLLAKGWNAFHNTKRRLGRPLKKLLRDFRKPFFLTYVAIVWSVSWSME